jgi:CRP-like cAMP-binding protein
VVALTEVQVLRIACADLARMMEEELERALCCMAMLHEQLLGVKRRVLERRLTTNERLLLVLQEVAWKAAPMDGKDRACRVPLLSRAKLVALAGLAQEKVSYALSSLQAKGALIRNGKS